MHSESIDKVIAAALAAAREQNISITVSIVDLGGHLIALRRMDASSFLGIEASRKKAVTASQLKTPTHVLSDVGQKVPELQQAFNKDLNILTIAGGFPIVVEGRVVAGLGISGGDFNQDKAVGEMALSALS